MARRADEFPEILSVNRYPQIRDNLALFRAVLQSQSNVGYVVAPYLSPDGQIEVDALAEGEALRWVVEIKWRNRQSGLKEMQKLLHKAQTLQGQPWYISQAGFTDEAVAFARENGVFLSSRAEIEALAKRIV